MSNLISSLHIAQSGLKVNETGIEVTGSNVSNANTEGYSRQVVQTTTIPALAFDGSLVGQGATVSGIDRAESSLITSRLVDQSASYGEETAQTDALATLENIFSVEDGSLSTAIEDFFAAWQTLSSNPSASTERDAVLASAETLAETFRQMDQDLDALQQDIDDSIESEVDTLNDQLAQLAQLNAQIVDAESGGVSANALRDERDLLLQEVSASIGVSYYETADGAVSVQLAAGVSLVIGDQAATVTSDRSDGQVQLGISFGASQRSLASDDLGGTLKGLVTVRDETVEEARDALDQLAYQIATSVNTVHGSGTDLDGNQGGALFSLADSSDPAGAAGAIALALTDTDQLAAGTEGLAGDNTNALTMLALQDEATMDGSGSFQEFYSQIAAGIGIEVSRNTTAAESAEDTLTQVQNMRDALAGVSIDEEMVLLTQYQSGYQAAAKYLSVVQDMLDTLMAL